MQYGAVIVAAGMSTRMKQFKPLMEVGGVSLAERIVRSFQSVGVAPIVMVTGYQAERLEAALAHLALTFVRNERYETTQMFDSVKLGLAQLQGKADRVFFCPIDVAFFSADTLRLEMSREENLVYPICHNRIGHPILFAGSMIPDLLAYNGPKGLKGALDSLYSQTTCFLPVGDEGAVMDADTPGDLQYLLALQQNRGIRVQTNVALAAEQPFFNEELRTLLAHPERLHTLPDQALRMIHRAEEQLGYALLQLEVDGTAALTDRGKRFVALYDELTLRVAQAAQQEFCSLFSAREIFAHSSREEKNQ